MATETAPHPQSSPHLLEVAPTVVEFTVPGKPVTWARAGRNPNGHSYTPTDKARHMAAVQGCWQQANLPRFDRDTMLLLECEFVFDRPASHFGTGRNAGVLKDRARDLLPKGGVNGGDIDNLVKLIADSLNGMAFHDDAQIAWLVARKRFVEVAPVRVLGETPPAPETAHTRVLLRNV